MPFTVLQCVNKDIIIIYPASYENHEYQGKTKQCYRRMRLLRGNNY